MPERRRLVTSVFCDLSGSTELAELVEAEAAYGVTRSYFDEARLTANGLLDVSRAQFR